MKPAIAHTGGDADRRCCRRLHLNAEHVRTCNSFYNSTPGLYASVNNITNTTDDTITSYISAAGIPIIANITEQYLEVVAPYAVWPVLLADVKVGVSWLWNMIRGKKMQSKLLQSDPSTGRCPRLKKAQD